LVPADKKLPVHQSVIAELPYSHHTDSADLTTLSSNYPWVGNMSS